MIGFGSIGKGTLPLIERHFDYDKSRFVIIDPHEDGELAKEHGVRFIKQGITKDKKQKRRKSSDTHFNSRRKHWSPRPWDRNPSLTGGAIWLTPSIPFWPRYALRAEPCIASTSTSCDF